MTLDKIIIIDDKALGQSHSSIEAISRLDKIRSGYLEYYESTIDLWAQNELGDDLKLLKDFSAYPYVFIHDSFDNPLIQDGLKSVLIEKLSATSRVVLFSGGKIESNSPVEKVFDDCISPNSKYFEVRRDQYFNNLKSFIDSYILNRSYQIKYLYNPTINPKKEKAYALLDNIKTALEDSISSAIESDSFNELLSLYDNENNTKLTNRFLQMNDDEFIENLEDFVENN
jgi:hypothetical protein